ncbi:hypothetical protein ICN35_00105 [Polynucleobacter sp. es-GGE-1]|uniref:hypothetical protein n=1 Tax=Polynucleobacter sp. es-GGE-1 TaxID=1819724 RepID=UPI001C0AB7AA|nr:hypothetical protein [Polynucleobacter sp. es-GGE-1]MBU3633865.1 hypothetical protein [Polynucleobacter sp. es-GGE-1]
MKCILQFTYLVIALSVTNVFSQDLESSYKRNRDAQTFEAQVKAKAKTQGMQFDCPYIGLLTFVDGFVFVGNADNLNSLGNYKIKGKGSISFSYSQYDWGDGTTMNVIVELNTNTKVLYKVYKYANPSRANPGIMDTQCEQKR